jgi:hypothetical protein
MISKLPEVVAQRDASTDKTAVHFRSSAGGFISENRISLTAKAGLHVGWPTACVTLMSPMLPASSPITYDRYMSWFSFRLIRDNHVIGGAEGSVAPYIAAAVSTAYAQNPAGDGDKESDRAEIELGDGA